MTAVPVCIAIRTTWTRIVPRRTVPGAATAWPLLVADPCPFTDPWKPGRHHGHVHAICEPWPAGRQLRLAPCCRQPYMLTVLESR